MQHNSQLPKNYKEKEAFRQFIREGIHGLLTVCFCLFTLRHKFNAFIDWLLLFVALGILKDEDGVPEDEENFEEAIRHVNTALNPTKVPNLKFSLHF